MKSLLFLGLIVSFYGGVRTNLFVCGARIAHHPKTDLKDDLVGPDVPGSVAPEKEREREREGERESPARVKRVLAWCWPRLLCFVGLF